MASINLLDEFERYKEVEEITYLYNLTEAKNNEKKFNEVKDDFEHSNKHLFFYFIYFLTAFIFVLFYISFYNTNQEPLIDAFNNVVRTSDFFMGFVFVNILVIGSFVLFCWIYFLNSINYLYQKTRTNKEKDLILEYNNAINEMNSIIKSFESVGKDGIIVLYEKLVEKHDGFFDSDYVNYEEPHEEFGSFYNLSSNFFNLREKEFDKEELEDAFILYSAKKNHSFHKKIEINNY